MKKLLAIILAIVMLLSFTACGQEKPITLEKGTVENGVYINQSAGFKINFDPWLDHTADRIIDETGEKWIDFATTHPTGNALIVIIQKTDKSVEEYIQSEKEKYLEDYEEDVVSCKNTVTKIAGHKMDCLEIEMNSDDLTTTSLTAVKKCENALLVIKVSSGSIPVDKILKMITKV